MDSAASSAGNQCSQIPLSAYKTGTISGGVDTPIGSVTRGVSAGKVSFGLMTWLFLKRIV